jgi:protein-S-isoprenylcysteine O-methyltransferase Ste14
MHQRAIDVGLGAATFGSVAVAIVRGHLGSVVGVTVAVINLAVALLFVVRRAPAKSASALQEVLAGLALPCGAIALALAPAPESWSAPALAAFSLGGLFAVVSLVTLGRSFAVLPSVRRLVVAGPYRLLRHPIYAAELVMVAAACAAARTWWPLVAAVVLTVPRVVIEERLLGGEPGYADYLERVRWRLVPLVW